MANELRARFNLVSGTLSGSLTNVATSMSAAGLANLGVIDSTNHAAITIENEIVWVTAHTGGATTATILRAQEGTSAAAHNSGVAWQHGETAYDLNTAFPLWVAAWTVHTPTLTQSATVTKTVNYSSYTRIGRTIIWQFKITPTAAGTTNNRLFLSPPVAPAATGVGLQIGAGSIFDTSAGTLVFGQWQIFSATQIGFQSQVGDLWGVLPNLPTGVGDELKGTVTFEAAS